MDTNSAATRIKSRMKGFVTRKKLKPIGNFTYVQDAAATDNFKKYKLPRRVKTENLSQFFNQSAKLNFFFEKGDPRMIKRNIVTMEFPERSRRIAIRNGKTPGGKNVIRLYNIGTLKSWILQSGKAETPLRNPISEVNKMPILTLSNKIFQPISELHAILGRNSRPSQQWLPERSPRSRSRSTESDASSLSSIWEIWNVNRSPPRTRSQGRREAEAARRGRSLYRVGRSSRRN